MIPPFWNASSPASVDLKVCKARTRVTMFPFSAIAEFEAAGVVVEAVVVVTTAEAGDAAGEAEELAAELDRMEDTWLCVGHCGCGWACGCW